MNKNTGEMRVLIVDDERLERQAIQLILEQASAPFIVAGEARNGCEAVLLARDLKPDIVVMDIKMPGMDGLAAAREIKEALTSVAIIFLTAYDNFDYAQEALRMGAVDFLLKPVRALELLEALEKIRLQLLMERKEQEELKRLQGQLAEAMPWLRVNLGLGLVFGLWEERDSVGQQARLVQLDVLPQVAFGVYVENHPKENLAVLTQSELLRFQLRQVIEEALSRCPHGLCLPLSERMLVGLWGSKKPEPTRLLHELAEDIVRKASENLSLGVTVGVGRFCDDLSELPRSVWEAQTAAHLGMFYLGPERVVHVDELERATRWGGGDETAREKELAAAVRSGNRDEVRRLFRCLLGSNTGGRSNDLYLIKARLMGIMVEFMRGPGIGKHDARTGEAACTYNEFARRLALCRSTEDLEEWLVELATSDDKFFAGKNEGVAAGMVKKVLDYIHDNYHRELTLAELSRIIFLSPDYFSRVFKEQLGCTFSEYIQRLRVEKAAELLADTDLPVGEVGRKVGYPDANYFSRVFGRAAGMSPSRYRQMTNGCPKC